MEKKKVRLVENNQLFHGAVHPLHLFSDKVKWMSAFGKGDSPCIASLSYQRDAYHSCATQLLVMVHLDHHPPSNENEESDIEEQIVLLSSDEFCKHYGIQENISLVIGVMPIFPLSKVVLRAISEDSFAWANSLSFERGLMVCGAAHKKLLARQGDWFLGQPQKIFGDNPSSVLCHFRDLMVVESYPVKQGYIYTDTEVIIIDGKEDILVEQYEGTEERSHGIAGVEILREIPKGINFDDGEFDPQCEVLCCEELAEEIHLRDQQIISLEIVFHGMKDYDGIDPQFSAEEIHDSAEEEEYFSIEMPVQAEETLETQSKFSITCRLRVAKPKQKSVFSAHESLHPSILYVSPALWFNSGCDEKLFDITNNVEIKVEAMREEEVPFAKEIHLALVLSPTYSPSSQFDQTLMKHLSMTRILKKSDVIAIDTVDNNEFVCESDMNDVSCDTLYYKVIKFGEHDEDSVHTYFQVNLKYTSVFQVGTVNSFIPRTIRPSMSGLCGLSDYSDEMKRVILPYLSGAIDDCAVGTVLISGPPGCGKKSVISATARLLNLHVLSISCYDLMADTGGATEAKITSAVKRGAVYSPCILVLNGIDCLGKDSETGQADYRICNALKQAIDSLHVEDKPVIVVAVAPNSSAVASKIRSIFLHKVEMRSLNEQERQKTLQEMLLYTSYGKDVDTHWIAKHTVGFTYGEFWALLRSATANAIERIKNECSIGMKLSWIDEMSICAAGIACQQCDFSSALKDMQSQRADIIGVPKIPDVKWDDIGGLEDVKATIQDTIQLPLEHPELVASGLRRSGILLYGPPGTGKTLLAKAVATQCSLSFLSVKGPELINMYVGQSEENVRKVFSRARDAAPCVVFFDELDSLAPNRGRSGDSGGVMDRVVSQLLAELDGLVEADAEKQIFVIGASNRPDLIDPALLRPGRFDKLLYVGVNTNKLDQLKILEAQTRRANLSSKVQLHEIVDLCPENMTGADFFALTSEAMMNAIRRHIETQKELRNDNASLSRDEKFFCVEQIDFLNAARNIRPSVSEFELSRFLEIKNNMVSGGR